MPDRQHAEGVCTGSIRKACVPAACQKRMYQHIPGRHPVNALTSLQGETMRSRKKERKQSLKRPGMTTAALLLLLCLAVTLTTACGSAQHSENAGTIRAEQTSLPSGTVQNAEWAEAAQTEASEAAQTESSEAVQTESSETAQTKGAEAAQTESSETAQTESSETAQTEKTDVTEITFTAVGDNLINEVLYGQAAERAAEEEGGNAYDFSPCYAKMAPFIQEHDVNWIDIETLMTDTLEPSGYPSFSTPGDSGRALVDAGWNVFSLCSNHTYDQGADGISETLDFWKRMKEEALQNREEQNRESAGSADVLNSADGICCTGLWENGTEYDIPVLTVKGRKLAFLTYTYGTNDIPTPADAIGHVIYLEEEGMIAEQIRLAREQADAVIVSLHWGEEYSHCETQEQRDLAQRVADMGADLIIGGHPHVVQGAEMLTAADGRKVFCAYSLGNFLCAQNSMPDPDAMIGVLLSCTFRFTDRGLSVENPALIPILSDYGDDYEDDHTVLYADYSREQALRHGMRDMFGFTQFDYDYVADMLTEVVGKDYLKLP